MNPTWNYWPTFLDVYPNIRLVPKIAAPLLILHVRMKPSAGQITLVGDECLLQLPLASKAMLCRCCWRRYDLSNLLAPGHER